MDSKSDNPPSAEGDPEPTATQVALQLYAKLGDRVPTIEYVAAWSAWVFRGDIPPSEFYSLQAYLDEFPLLVKVGPGSILVTDPGFGMGAMEWHFRVLDAHSEAPLVALTETDLHTENRECKIWIGEYRDGEWQDCTEQALPEITRASFFGQEADIEVLEEFELVGLQYVLSHQGYQVDVHPIPNASLECIDGRVNAEDLPDGAEVRICEAWRSFRNAPISCTFDPKLRKFTLAGAKSDLKPENFQN